MSCHRPSGYDPVVKACEEEDTCVSSEEEDVVPSSFRIRPCVCEREETQ